MNEKTEMTGLRRRERSGHAYQMGRDLARVLQVARVGRAEVCGIDVSNIQQRNTSECLPIVVAENSQTDGKAKESNLDDISLSRDQRVYNNG